MTTAKVAIWSAALAAATVLLVAEPWPLCAQHEGSPDPFHRAEEVLPQPTLNPANPGLQSDQDQATDAPDRPVGGWQTVPPTRQPQGPNSQPQGDFRQGLPQSRYSPPPQARPGDQGPYRAPSGDPPRISTRQNTFAIPFTVAQPADGQPAPKEVQLHVTEATEQRWRLDSRVAPTEKRFLFRAPRDGEYWFQVRTIDTTGQLIGPPTQEPGLRVLVDTTAPQLDIQPQMQLDGQLEVSWTVHDLHLTPNSLKLEYQIAANADWQPIPGLDVNQSSQQTSPGKLAGKFSWPLGVSEGAISIRGEVADAAGNRNVILRRVHVSEQLAKLREQQQQEELARQREQEQRQRFAGYSSERPAQGPAQDPRGRSDANQVRNDGSQGWPADDHAYRPPMQDVAGNPQQPASPLPYTGGNGDGEFWTASDRGPQHDRANPQVASQYRRDPPNSTTESPAQAQPAGQGSPRYVRSKSFLLDYGVDTLTGTRKRIILWATRDGGRSWERFGEDPDGQSPFEVTVAEPGLYGFSIVAEAANTQQEYVPRSGEPAQSWIMVDPDAPKAKLTSVQLDPDGETASLRIRWEAFDENLLERPVSIFLSDRPDGQWFRIATDLANSGQYMWRLDDGLPPEIYLRLVVRDEAGNVAEHIAEQPVRLDDLRPAVQIRGVRSSQRGRGPSQVLILE